MKQELPLIVSQNYIRTRYSFWQQPGRRAWWRSRLSGMEKWGAIWGQGTGLQGQTYGIPTMHGGPEAIRPYVDEFIRFAKEHSQYTFLVTEIGCGIAGFAPKEIAPLFKEAADVSNIHLPQRFWDVLNAK